MDALVDENEDVNEKQPSPEDFDQFLPWACVQFQLNLNINIINVLSKFADTERETKSKFSVGKNRRKKSSSAVLTAKDCNTSTISLVYPTHRHDNIIKLCTIYDNAGNLTQLKFDKNKNVPRQILQIVGLISQFHKFLTGITINQGLNRGCLHELNILTCHANVTDICLDNTCIGDGSYDILLEKSNNLRNLSLSRCNVDDDTVNRIASKLHHPMPASHTLSLLNLASNFISDIGAKYLALALKTNRTLVYLNLSDNTITDDGADAILDVLTEFTISKEDVVNSRVRHVHYLKVKKELVDEMIVKLKADDFEKKIFPKQSIKPHHANTVGTNIHQKKSANAVEGNKIEQKTDSHDAVYLEKAEFLAETKLGEFREAYSPENVVTKNGLSYCRGNNQLAYLNLSYNNIGYLTVKKIVKVLNYQKEMNRKPRGLAIISIEGTCISSKCPELEAIDSILASYFIKQPKRASTTSNTLSVRGKPVKNDK